MRTKRITKKREASVNNEGDKKGKAPPSDMTAPADDMKAGGWRNSGSPPTRGSSTPAPCSSSYSRTSATDTTATASPPSSGDLLPMSVEEMKSSTARPHLSSARRSPIFHRSFYSQVSFGTSAHRIFCWAFHSGRTLKRCSRVCFLYWHHQYCGMCRSLVQLRYCPVRQCSVLRW